MPKATLSEQELIDRLRQKDRSALEYLYDHYAGALFGIVSRILKDDVVAEEVLQDVFVRIWERIHLYDSKKGRLFTWMLKLARNQAIDKTRSREISQVRKTGDIDLYVHTVDRQNQTELSVETIGLPEVLSLLSEEHRFVVVNLYLNGYTQSELAEEYDIPLGTVKTRLRAAMTELRKLLRVS